MSSSSVAVRLQHEPVALGARVALVAFCLAVGLGYRASVSVVPAGIAEVAFVVALALVLLAIALIARGRRDLEVYWAIPFAFFVFVAAALFGDGNISPFQRLFVQVVLHQTTTANNPLASTVAGTVLAQVFGTALLATPVIVLTLAFGGSLESIFLGRPKEWLTLIIAVVCFLVVYFLALRGRTESFFPTHGTVTASRVLAWTPALVVLVLLNGFREELWFRALFLKKYACFFTPLASNILAAVVFASFHVEVRYSASIVLFLAYALAIGLVAGWMMQRSNSILASTIFHAGTDIPIFLVYLSWVSP